jgi:hypothetical protein
MQRHCRAKNKFNQNSQKVRYLAAMPVGINVAYGGAVGGEL